MRAGLFRPADTKDVARRRRDPGMVLSAANAPRCHGNIARIESCVVPPPPSPRSPLLPLAGSRLVHLSPRSRSGLDWLSSSTRVVGNNVYLAYAVPPPHPITVVARALFPAMCLADRAIVDSRFGVDRFAGQRFTIDVSHLREIAVARARA